jgi:hypothetical protein
MLPHGYELPAAILLVFGGALACFAGYRLFRVVLGLYGFILGAMIGSSMMGVTNSVGMIAAAIAGGVLGAVVLVFAYLVGIALVGAGLGVLVTHLVWNAARSSGASGELDAPAVAVVLAAIFGAVVAMVLQRYVIIIGTAFGGAWTLIVGALAATGDRAAMRAAAASDAWILYPLTPAPGERWVPIAWVALGVVGTAVQLGLTARKR